MSAPELPVPVHKTLMANMFFSSFQDVRELKLYDNKIAVLEQLDR